MMGMDMWQTFMIIGLVIVVIAQQVQIQAKADRQ